MANQFTPGTIVQLRSGGPRMTVLSYDENTGLVKATWFADNKVCNGRVPEAALKVFLPPFARLYQSPWSLTLM